MPSFASSLSPAGIQALAAWVASSAGGSRVVTISPSGLSSKATTRVQRALKKLGFFHGPVTGFYGPLTTAAVRRFQRSVGLTADGLWGPKSAAALQHRLG
jgi:N-acetylmuramoyl-L-alanine amidase